MEAEEKPHSQPPPSWSALPLDLASMVLRLLPAYSDRARFAAVCPQWRAAARQLQPPTLPLLVLPDGTFYSLPYDEPFRFPGCGFAGYKSACGSWLVFPHDDGCFLVDPFCRATVTLPALSCVRLRSPNAVAKWSSQHGARITEPYVTWMHMKDSDKPHIKKLILCSSNLVAAVVGLGPLSQILICQPGASSWSVRAYDRLKMYEDMAFYQGKLYAVADDEKLLVVNISEDNNTGDPQVSKIGRVIEDKSAPSWGQGRFGCLPEPGVSDKAIAGQSEFEVFEADFEHSRWIRVSTVEDDQVLFLGRRCSRAVSVSQYGLLGNHIFFLDDDDGCLVNYVYGEENTSCSAYDMRLGDVSSPHPMISWKRHRETRLAAWLFPQD
ncbi:hypothetical protein ACQ4PT_032070 [Festuca glaucescens]